VLDGGGIGDSIPDGLLVTKEIIEGVDFGLGFEEEPGHAVSILSGRPGIWK
jgi:hypothetical protein